MVALACMVLTCPTHVIAELTLGTRPVLPPALNSLPALPQQKVPVALKVGDARSSYTGLRYPDRDMFGIAERAGYSEAAERSEREQPESTGRTERDDESSTMYSAEGLERIAVVAQAERSECADDSCERSEGMERAQGSERDRGAIGRAERAERTGKSRRAVGVMRGKAWVNVVRVERPWVKSGSGKYVRRAQTAESASSADERAGSSGWLNSKSSRGNSIAGGMRAAGAGAAATAGGGGGGNVWKEVEEKQLDPQRLFVGNLPWKIPAFELIPALVEMFAQFGSVENVEVAYYPLQTKTAMERGKHRGYAFVRMSSQLEAATCMAALHGTSWNGFAMQVLPGTMKTPPPVSPLRPTVDSSEDPESSNGSRSWDLPRSRAGDRPRAREQRGPAPWKHYTKIYVGGLSQSTTDETLRKHFGAFGNVVDCKIVRSHSTGRSRGTAYVTMADELSAWRAAEGTNGRQLDDMVLNVRIANDQDRINARS